MEIVLPIIAAVLGLGLGAGGVFVYNKKNENKGNYDANKTI